jgi:hypothetical protein
MSLKQCPGCAAMVPVSKAYCPDCGAAMDEEQLREAASEYESQSKTQNLNSTSQLLLLEEFNLSNFYEFQQKKAGESKGVEDEAPPAPAPQAAAASNPAPKETAPPPPAPSPLPSQANYTENRAKAARFNSSDNLKKTIHLSAQATMTAKTNAKLPNNSAAEPNKKPFPQTNPNGSARQDSNSKKYLFIFGGVFIILFFVLVAATLIILNIFYWN